MYRIFSNGLVLFLAFMMVFSPFASNAQAAPQPDKITLAKVSGDVKVLRGSEQISRPQAGIDLAVNDEIVTGTNSTADVKFPSAEVIRIMGNSRLKINQGTPSQISVGLSKGKIFNVVYKYVDKVTTYKVTTPTAVAGVRGTVFSAEVDDAKTSVIMVKEGKVSVASTSVKTGDVMVADLQKTVVEKGKAPTIPVALTAAEIALFAIISDLLSAGAGTAAAVAAGTKAGLSAGAIAAIAGGVAVAGGVAAAASSGGGGGDSHSTTPIDTPPVTVTGTWEVHFRCSGAATDALILSVSLNESSGGNFSGSGSGKDYDEKSLTMNLNGTYNSSSHLLTAQTIITSSDFPNNPARVDNFSTTLQSNDTGYVPTTCSQNCDFSCTADMRMIKK